MAPRQCFESKWLEVECNAMQTGQQRERCTLRSTKMKARSGGEEGTTAVTTARSDGGHYTS